MVKINGIDYLVTALERQTQKRVKVLESISSDVVVQAPVVSNTYTLTVESINDDELTRLLSLANDKRIVVVDVGNGEYLFGIVKGVSVRERGPSTTVELSLVGAPGWGATLINDTTSAEPTLTSLTGAGGRGLYEPYVYARPSTTATRYIIDWDNKYVEYDVELTNMAYEHVPAVLSDDTQASVWSAVTDGSGGLGISVEDTQTTVASGNDSLKLNVVSGSYSSVGIKQSFSTSQDWTQKDFLSFWIYGTGSGLPIHVYVYTPDTSNYAEWIINDTVAGWRHVVLPLRAPDNTVGIYNQSSVASIAIMVSEGDGWTSTKTLFIDRVVVDEGAWVILEVMVPDKIQYYPPSSDGVSYAKYEIYTYNPVADTWEPCHTFNGTDVVDIPSSFYLLNGKTLADIYGSEHGGGLSTYNVGDTGNAVGKARVVDVVEPSSILTYTTWYGTRRRVGFAVRMSPAGDNINSVRLRLRIYFEDVLTTPSL